MSLLDLVDTMKCLSSIHYEILRIMEKSIRRFEYVPLQYIAKRIRIKPNKLEEIMNYLNKHKLIKRKTREYTGFTLTYKGLDVIALRDLGAHGVITKVGPKIGMGKEGDIWVAYLDNTPRIIKLFRISRESFRKIKFHRYYYIPKRIYSWFELSFRSAYREFKALALLYRSGVHVPPPIARSRHVIVMGYIDGRELVKTILEDPTLIFRKIIVEIAKAYKAGIVHADLSEYNILVTPDAEVYIIDWPQYIASNHPDALKYFEGDVTRIIKYFSRKYRVPGDQLRSIIQEEFKKLGLKIEFI